jgi:hypothetical protein
LKEIVRGGRRVTAATFKVGMRVRRSGGGARPEADRAAAPQWGNSPAHVLDPREGSSPPASREDEANREETGRRRGRHSRGGRVMLAALGYGNEAGENSVL